MPSLNSSFSSSHASSGADASSVTFGTDQSQADAFLSASVIPSASFARLMLLLGSVVRMQDFGQVRDHSAYQDWVMSQYLKQVPDRLRDSEQSRPHLLAHRQKLDTQARHLSAELRSAIKGDPLRPERHAFWRWLYDHNRDAWLVLDPIVSVQPDATFFEAFSLDESIYARVVLPHEALDTDAPVRTGTTNIDFSIPLERELARARTYRPLHLTVGSDHVGLGSQASAIIERKIDLPDTWVRGLLEVQAALALAPLSLNLSAPVLADILARLASEREKEGPRSLRFELKPGEPVRVIVEPWDEAFVDPNCRYTGATPRAIRVWGRRRLRALTSVLPYVDIVRVDLVDSGMPSFWTVTLDGVGLTLGLSGWTAQDWAGRARFAAMSPASVASPEQTAAAADLLQQRVSMTVDDLVAAENMTPAAARSALQRLCLEGKAMFDVDRACYRWRVLFAALDLDSAPDIGLEERKGVELATAKAVQIITDDIADGQRSVTAQVTDPRRVFTVEIRTNIDGRVTYATCECSHFRHNKLRQGPCRHIVAASTS